MDTQYFRCKKIYLFFYLFILTMLGLSACGRQKGTADSTFWAESDQVAVADFQQMKLPITLEALEQYATDGKWFYISREKFGPESTTGQVLRSRIQNNFEGEVFISKENAFCLALAVDRESHCFVLWKEENNISLEKYGESGERIWHVDQDVSKWTDIGRNNSVSSLAIAGGVVTTDGRLALYTHGTDTIVALFDENGNLLQMDAPKLECLDGIVAGKDNRVYGYCITGEGDPVLADLKKPESCYVLPFRPLNVFSGQEEGVYLSTLEGLWLYDPESGRTQIKWKWNDEYINVDYRHLQSIFCGDQEWHLLCHVPDSFIAGTSKVTVVSVRNESRKDYGKKETITLGYVDNDSNQSLEMLVNLYNRQSKIYRVELVAYKNQEQDVTGWGNELALQLLRGEGPDLMDVRSIYVGSLADKGAICDLSDYYIQSPALNGEAILDVVWSGMQCKGKNMLVIPSFCLMAQASKEPVNAEDWTPGKLIQLAKEQEMLWQFGTSPMWALWDCMRPYDEYTRYIDYDEKKSHFDCPEFRWLLENCAEIQENVIMPEIIFTDSTVQPSFLYSYTIHNMNDFFWHCQNIKELGCSWVGNPSWDGAVYRLVPDNILAMNQKSENKEGAWDFLQYIISEECQNDIDWSFPVREDSFERYLAVSYRSKEENDRTVAQFHYSTNYFDPDEKDFDNIRYMISHAFIQRLNGPVESILNEETEMYFAGDATLDDTIHKIDSRVTLYLNE